MPLRAGSHEKKHSKHQRPGAWAGVSKAAIFPPLLNVRMTRKKPRTHVWKVP